MRAYLDSSVIIALLTRDAHTARAETFFVNHAVTILVSDFAAAEFASVVSRHVRTRIFSKPEGRLAFLAFDAWKQHKAQHVGLCADDVKMATSYLRRLDLTLLAPDALHIAMARRLGAALVTFDAKMAASGRALGLEIAEA